MSERITKTTEISKKLARKAGETAVKTARFTYKEIKAHNERRRLVREAESDTRLVRVTVALGGHVDHVFGREPIINDKELVKRHEMNRRYHGLESAIGLALKATGAVDVAKTKDDFHIESDSIVVNQKDSLLDIRHKQEKDYSIVRFKSGPEFYVRTDGLVDPNTGNTIVPYYERIGASYDERLPDGSIAGSGGGSYKAPEYQDNPIKGFDRGFEYIDRAAREIGQAAYSDLQNQGVELTEQIQEIYQRAIGR